MLLPQDKNIKKDEFDAIGDMFSKVNWELPMAEEYRNDLLQPQSLGLPSVPKSFSNALVAQQAKLDPNSPISPGQWTKVEKMVAWLRTNPFLKLVFRKYPSSLPPHLPVLCSFV